MHIYKVFFALNGIKLHEINETLTASYQCLHDEAKTLISKQNPRMVRRIYF